MTALPVQIESPQRARATPPLRTVPAGFVRLFELCEAFEGSDHARARAARRWCDRLPDYQRYREGKHNYVSEHARLPNGQTVMAWRIVGSSSALLNGIYPRPEGFRDWPESKRSKHLAAMEFIDLYDDCKRRYPGKFGKALEGVVRLEHGAFAAKWGFGTSERTVRDIRSKLHAGISYEGRGRPALGAVKCSAEAWDYFRSEYLTPKRRKMAGCVRDTQGKALKHGWECPNNKHAVKYFERRVKAEIPPAIADRFRLGERRWKAQYQTRTERDFTQYRANECWNGDRRQLDAICLDASGKPCRPYMTAFQDMRSRLVPGFVLGTRADTDSNIYAFRAAVLKHGCPEEMLLDNGKDYRAHALSGGRKRRDEITEEERERMAGLFGKLGVEVHFAEVYSPQSKPIEAFFKFMAEDFDKRLPTYCGHKPDARPETLYADMRAGGIEVPTLDQVRELLAQWLDTLYHVKGHSGDGMNGRSPKEVFETADPIAKKTAPRDVLDLLLMKPVRVTVTKNGVQYMGVHYGQSAPELWRITGQEVELRVDPYDASYLYVCELDGRVICEAFNQTLRGVTPEQVAEGQKRKRRQQRFVESGLKHYLNRHKSVADHAIEAAAEAVKHEQLKSAVGAEYQPVQRNVQLLPGAAIAAENLNRRREAARDFRSIAEVPISDFELPRREPTLLELLRDPPDDIDISDAALRPMVPLSDFARAHAAALFADDPLDSLPPAMSITQLQIPDPLDDLPECRGTDAANAMDALMGSGDLGGAA